MPAILLALAAALTGAADTSRWVVDNHGREAGELVVVAAGDSVTIRYLFRDRNRGIRLEHRYRVGPDGLPVSGESRPILEDGRAGEPTEWFAVAGDWASYHRAETDSVERLRRPAGAWTALRTETPWERARMAGYLLGRPDRSAPLTTGGTVRASIVGDTTVVGRHARLVMIQRDRRATPDGVWLDDAGELEASDAQWFIAVRPERHAVLPVYRRIELGWREAEGERISASVRKPVPGALVIRNGDLFDSETGTVRPRQTVVVEGDRIVRVGPADQVRAPAGAVIIDATSKTIMPGMWDMHTHLQVMNQSTGSLVQLANGLTTVRDLAADDDVAMSQRDREQAGRLASPRVILAGFIEGPLRWAGPSASLAATEAAAETLVRSYAERGYRQIKLYNLVHPDLVPGIAAETKRHGMLLSGHIPRGMSIRAAVELGYDEIQHAAFLLSDFFPDSLYIPRMRAYSAVATAVAPTFDVDGPGMTSLIAFLARHQTRIDGTFNLWIGGGASIVGAGGSRDQSRADSTYLRLIRRLYDAGVPLVAGTDNSLGTTYRRELEMYELAGIPAPKVLQIATIEAARFMKDERDYGSIREGKVADILVVDGRPAERIGDLAGIETIVRGGRLYRAGELMDAAGMRQARRARRTER